MERKICQVKLISTENQIKLIRILEDCKRCEGETDDIAWALSLVKPQRKGRKAKIPLDIGITS